MPIQSSNPPEVITLQQFVGLNQSVARGSIDDNEMWWSENLIPLGPGNLRSAWGPSAPLYAAPAGVSIVRLFGFVLNCIPYIACCQTDGSIAMVNILPTVGVTVLPGVWTPQPPLYPMAIKVWLPVGVPGSTQPLGGLVIGSAGTLYAWDGTTVTGPGQLAPTWLTNGSTMLDPGGSGQQVPSSLPTAGSLPNPINGMEVFEGSLWVMGRSVISFSAPGNGADYATGDGGGSFPYQGDQLVCSYNAIRAGAGILYLFGDSSTDSISYVQTSGTPPVTTFSRINVDPQIGQWLPREVAVWGRAFVLNSDGGIYALFGGATQWISQKIIDLFARRDTNAIIETQTTAHIFGRKVVLLNAALMDPWGLWRNLILVWMGDTQEWTVASQRVTLTHITSYELNSIIVPYGTDGTSLYQLFAQPDPQLEKRLSTKSLRGKSLTGIKNWTRVFVEAQDNTKQGVSFTGSLITQHGGIPAGTRDIGFEIAPGLVAIVPQPVQSAGITGEIDLRSNSPDFTIERIHLYYEDRVLFGA